MRPAIPTFRQLIGPLSVFLYMIPAAAFAATDYLLVPDLPFIRNTTDLSSYLKGMFNLGLGLAVTLTILMLVINGIKYMVSDITGEKSKARDGMKDALIGLVIVFGSVLILNTINPRLTQFNLVDSINRTVAAIKKGQAAQPRPPVDEEPGGTWPDDSAERSRLAQAGIGFNNPNCTSVGQRNCTSVAGLQPDVIASLINLKQKCNCDLVITGGTEHWAHSTHGDSRTIDLRDSNLTAWLGGKGATCNATKVKEGITFKWEDKTCSWCGGNPRCGSHWHVKF